MLRGHFKTLAIYSLITTLLAGQVLAATPGAASRRAAQRGRTPVANEANQASQTTGPAVRNAVGVRQNNDGKSIRQVVGKQPGSATANSNRGLSLLPNLFGNGNAAPINRSQQATPKTATSKTTTPKSTPRTSARRNSTNDPTRTPGILSDLFGSRGRSNNSNSKPQATTPAATTPAEVNWDGIPYHQARSKTKPNANVPIRDPNPNETRIAGPSRLSAQPIASAPEGVNPAVPKPPALAPAPTSRRIPRQVVSSRVTVKEDPALSPLSSSRRSGRRSVPTLDASEIAAAKKNAVADKELIPQVAKRDLENKATTPKPSKPEPAQTKPAASAIAKSEPKKVTAKPNAPAKPEPAKTPSAEVAVNPQPKPKQEPKVAPPKAAPAPESIAANTSPAAAGPTAPESPAKPAVAAPAPVETNSIAASETVPAEVAADKLAPPQRSAELASPKVEPAPQRSQIAAAAPASTPQSPATEITPTSPDAPEFVSPQLPLPAAPQFGTRGSVAGHRVGPPETAFQPRTARPRLPQQPVLNPSGVPFGPPATPVGTAPVGSGVAAQPAPQPTPQPQFAASEPQTAPAQPLPPSDYAPETPYPQVAPAPVESHAQGSPYVPQPQQTAQPYGARPYAATPQYQPSRNQPIQTPTYDRAAVPGYRPIEPARVAQNPYQQQYDPYANPRSVTPAETSAGTALGRPLPQARPSAIPTTPHSLATQPARPTPTDSRMNRYADNVPSGHSLRSPLRPNMSSALPAGETAVASELPGIRVITHGPSSIIIRQAHEFEIRVENRGSIDATGVMIRTAIPDWADIKGQSTSRGQIENQFVGGSDRLVWALDSLPAGTSETLTVRLQALESGTHNLDVDWTLVPQKSIAKVEVREPKLDLVIEGPESVVFGESQTYRVRVLNPGDGVASNVVFTLSPNSSTPQTQRIGNIPSGKEAQFEVELTAQDLGDLKIDGLASGDLGLKAEAAKTIEVTSADLEAVMAGPELKYQNTDASYHLQLSNNGKATCKNVVASLSLPPGIRYLGGIDGAHKRGTKLTWEIDSLPPGATRDYEFNCTMLSPGEQTFDFAAQGSAAGRTSVALGTRVESIADLVMTIQDPAAPAPVGSEVVYEILIKNRGSRQAQGVRAIAQFSNGIEPRRIEGHSGQVLTGQVLFDPIDVIRPGEEVRIRVIAEAEREGHHRFRTEIRSGETVLVSEEATQYLSKRSERVSRRSSDYQR